MSTFHNNERDFLARANQGYVGRASDFYLFNKELCANTLLPYLHKNATLLELGCGWGDMTKLLCPYVRRLVSVDGCADFLDQAKEKVSQKHVEFVNSLFEDLPFRNEFDVAIAAYILEHVQDPLIVLQKVHTALKTKGTIYSVVPNAMAFSRQLAVEMGLMQSVFALTENDIAHGHRHTFEMNAFLALHKDAGFTIIDSGAHFFKPFADSQMRSMLDAGIIGKEQLLGLHKMAVRYPELSNGIYVLAQKE